jgi:hypothetical protein
MALSKINTNSIADDAVTTAKVNPAQTDITSVGTLSSLGVTGTTKLGEIASIGQATPLSPNDATSFLHIGDNNNQDTSIILEDAVEIWEIYQNDTLSFRKDTTIVQELHRDGYVTMPLQTSFLAQPTSVQSNIAANSWVNIVFGTERYDVNGDFASPTFTAPVTGKYMMTFGLDLRQVPNDASGLYWVLATSNRTYYAVEDTSATLAATATNTAYNLSVVADFDANDTCTVMIWYNGTASIDCQTDSFWSGHLLG